MVMHFRVSDERKKERKKLSIYATKTFYANVKNATVGEEVVSRA